MAEYDRATRLAQARRKKGLPQTKVVYDLLLKADKNGDARATYALATWYLHGSEFTKRNVARATALLKIAATADVAAANYDLAVSHEKGIGVRKSESRAFELYVKAALLGDADSFIEVGRMYFYGLGTRQNRRLAETWFKRGESLGADRSIISER